MTLYERAKMQQGRFNSPLAMVRDRFIFAIGGQTSDRTATSQCEVFDTMNNAWFSISPLNKPAANTSAIVMNNRFIYLMPGAGIPDDPSAQKPETCTIEILDTGSSYQFSKETNAGQVIAKNPWKSIQVQNKEFNLVRPSAGIQLTESEILIFGGIAKRNFVLDLQTS
jgi:hypothetical protein